MKPTHVIFDVDDVILDMDRCSEIAEMSVEAPLIAALGAPAAKGVHTAFRRSYDTLRQQLRAPKGASVAGFDALDARIRHFQRGLAARGQQIKIFSRECLLACALEANHQPVEAAIIHAAIDHYWDVLTENTKVFEDARTLIGLLRERDVFVHLATNSDGFMRFDDASAGFVYAPEYAFSKKLARLGCVRELGFEDADVSIGDPIGKPNVEFFEVVLARFSRAVGAPVPVATTLAVGDSLKSDILPLFELGVVQGAWILRDGSRPKIALPAGARVISSLLELEALW